MTTVQTAFGSMVGLMLAILPQSARAQASCAPRPVARIESIKNSVQLVPASTKVSTPAPRQALICAGDVIQVGDDSRAVVVMLGSNTPLVIDQNSEFIVTEGTSPGATTIVELLRGALLFITRVRRSVEIRTRFVNAAIEGTEFVVRVQPNQTEITVFEGTVLATNSQGMLLVGAGQQAVAVQGQAPQLQPIDVVPRDAVRWALYYEPVTPALSVAELAAIPESSRDETFYVRRASFRLGAGDLVDARSDLDEAQKLDPANGDAHALRTIVEVALNNKAEALKAGEMAVTQAPMSPAAHVALSYAQQANLQLEAARDSATRATELAAKDGGAWARLAELRLMLDDVGGAVEAARRAVDLSPRVGRTESALGFALLAQLEISDARAAFERAIGVEPDNPLARLGLGLARIRQGSLAEGRGEIELAMALSPDNSLIRSYLGKAYFEEKREPLPAEQFGLAKQLDPMDPTPWFYDAIRNQTLNRPVEALREMERSIALNDNRAVYRSAFLLEQDEAARNASLARVYRDLGFEQLALSEASKSLEADPGDHSGHQFLAEAYSAMPRHEVARVSEVLQAQLLQPISLAPVPPRLAETDLFILDGVGPDKVRFNEFNPLFSRNRLAVQFSGAAGSESLLGDEVTVSGVWNKLSFSVGQFHYETDGLRENNHQDLDLYNAFIQAQLTHGTTVQAEFRSEDRLAGDLFIRFDPTNFSPDLSESVESRTARFGIRHAFSTNSQLIGSISLRREDFEFSQTVSGSGPATATTSTLNGFDGVTAEVRHLFRVGRLSLNSGLGRFDGDRQIKVTTAFGPPINRTSITETSEHPEQTNAYTYSLVDLPQSLTITMGASGDSYKRDGFERTQFNPKFGTTWSPVSAMTIRVAAFRTLHRALVARQTIEPTQVAGFNQLFADDEAEETRRYGIAVDHKINERLFGGASYSWRSLWLPVEFQTGPDRTVRVIERSEQLGHSYLYWAPDSRVSFRMRYLFERFDREPGAIGSEAFHELRTHRVQLGVRYFARSGLSARVNGAYIEQQGVFVRGTSVAGEDSFWVVDGAIEYRFPRRYGQVIFEVKNLFDQQFAFQDTDPRNPTVRASRLAVLRFTVGV